LCQTRNFAGSVALIFQPAEEGGGGGDEMVKDGMMERFGIAEVYGMHNEPGLPVGHFGIREGAFLASMDTFSILIKGKGGHAAMPHLTVDPIFIGAQIVTALQGIASRNANPVEAVVVSITQFNGGEIHNVIAPTATLIGTVRTLNKQMRQMARENLIRTVTGVATSLGGEAEINYDYLNGYPVTVNHARETGIALKAARDVAGVKNVDPNCPPIMGSEDFAFMLEARPGAFIFIGNGDSAYCHHPAFDFADDAIPYGVSFWVRLAEMALAKP
jgi:hippurate hydrolase